MIAIIDYDAGNIRSVEKALLALGQDVTVTADRDEILHADNTWVGVRPSAAPS